MGMFDTTERFRADAGATGQLGLGKAGPAATADNFAREGRASVFHRGVIAVGIGLGQERLVA